MKDPKITILAPIITEKTSLERAMNRYTFKVDPRANKVEIKYAISKLFKVKVKDVNTVRVRGKVRGFIRGVFGKTSSYKKAYVTLESGQKIEELETA